MQLLIKGNISTTMHCVSRGLNTTQIKRVKCKNIPLKHLQCTRYNVI